MSILVSETIGILEPFLSNISSFLLLGFEVPDIFYNFCKIILRKLDTVMKLKICIAFILFSLLIINCHSAPKTTWATVLNAHLKQYPALESADLYKIIYQGAMGPNHLGAEKQSMTTYLNQELATVIPNEEEALTETISPHSKYIRINLKKFKALNGDPEILADLLFHSCQLENIAKLKSILAEVTQLIATGKIDYPREKWGNYYNSIQEKNYFVPHHSQKYRELYSPAYRVVNKNLWEQRYQEVFD
jgi:hypothetical protein